MLGLHYHFNKTTTHAIDWLIPFLAIIGPLMTIPQCIEIGIYHNTAGVSFITWFAYLVISFFWLAYGIIHKIKPIIWAYVGWIIVESLIVIGLILY